MRIFIILTLILLVYCKFSPCLSLIDRTYRYYFPKALWKNKPGAPITNHRALRAHKPAHTPPGPYTRKTRVLMRKGLSKEVMSPALSPGTGNSRAERGLRQRAARAAVSRSVAAILARGVSPGSPVSSQLSPPTHDLFASSFRRFCRAPGYLGARSEG